MVSPRRNRFSGEEMAIHERKQITFNVKIKSNQTQRLSKFI